MKLITELSRNVQVSSNDLGNLFIEGIFSSAEIQNSNGRKYKKEILDREMNKITEKINGKCLWGELGHPESPDINLDKIAIMIESLGWDGDNICGRAKVIDTPMGQIAKTLIKEGNLGISSRGLGTVNESDGYVNEDYCLITWDLVGEPSNHPSWIKGVYEGRDFNPPAIVVEPIIDINEAKSQYYKTIWQVLENISKTL